MLARNLSCPNAILKEVTSFEHVITSTGVKYNEGLIAAVRDFPEPGNVKELRRFPGLASYYRRFIPNLPS